MSKTHHREQRYGNTMSDQGINFAYPKAFSAVESPSIIAKGIVKTLKGWMR
jgi:hypothetical protein